MDITADFIVYGATIVGVAVGATSGHGAPWWPFLLVLLAYYVNGTAFLAFSSIAERTGRTIEDGRSLSFLGGLAEGPRGLRSTASGSCCPRSPGRLPWCGLRLWP